MSCFTLTIESRELALTFEEKVYTIEILHKPISIQIECYNMEAEKGIGRMIIEQTFKVR